MSNIFPAKLKAGDGVRVIAPSRSLALPFIDAEAREEAEQKFRTLGLNLSISRHANELDEFDSSSIQSRVEDLHDAFSDPTVRLIIPSIGGFNSNQLLRYLDYDLIRNNPKILCGYSDITALTNAIFAKAGLVTYVGPHFFAFGNKKGFEYTLEHFKKCVMSDEPFDITLSQEWSDDRWAGNQQNRTFLPNDGFWILNGGTATGTIIGGNQCTLNLLHGTDFMPDITDSVLFLEEDAEASPGMVDRDLQSIIHQPQFEHVRAIVFGRFQRKTAMTRELLTKIVKSKRELDHMPIIANIDFGHTAPMITIPIGGEVALAADSDNLKITITKH